MQQLYTTCSRFTQYATILRNMQQLCATWNSYTQRAAALRNMQHRYTTSLCNIVMQHATVVSNTHKRYTTCNSVMQHAAVVRNIQQIYATCNNFTHDDFKLHAKTSSFNTYYWFSLHFFLADPERGTISEPDNAAVSREHCEGAHGHR